MGKKLRIDHFQRIRSIIDIDRNTSQAAVFHHHHPPPYHPQVSLHAVYVCILVGGSNCGLFAIAFASALINGKQPGSIVHANSFKCVLAVYACTCMRM